MPDTKISQATPKPSLDPADMLPVAAAGQNTAYHVTGETLFNSIPSASTAAKGAVELATGEETQAGTDETRAVTPAGLKSGRVRLAQQLPAGAWYQEFTANALVNGVWTAVDLAAAVGAEARAFYGMLMALDVNESGDPWNFVYRPYGAADSGQVLYGGMSLGGTGASSIVQVFGVFTLASGKIEVRIIGMPNARVNVSVRLWGWW